MRIEYIFLSSILIWSWSSEACLNYMDQEKTKDAQGIWDEVENPREIVDSCECGRRPNGNLPWNVFVGNIEQYDLATDDFKICIGTIITSNLILTSHKCLQVGKNPMNLYDAWKPNNTNNSNIITNLYRIYVTQNHEYGAGEEYIVEDVIYNNRYAYTSGFGLPPVNDVVIIKVAADFTSASSTFRPICIPDEKNFKNVDLFEATGVYYGAGPWHESPIRNATSLELPINYALGRQCDKTYEDGDGDSRRLCTWYKSNGGCSPADGILGGPLIVSPQEVAYLVGLSMEIISDGTYENVFFTNIYSMAKYLEHHAKIHKSKWCKSPLDKVDLSTHKFPLGVTFGKEDWSPFGTHPWEDASKSFPREESIDCMCGKANSKLTGRIAGGTDTHINEFPWMVWISRLYRKGMTRECGGTIINDRMILTSGNCLIAWDVYDDGTEQISFLKWNIFLQINTHKRNDSTIKSVKLRDVHVHPNFELSVRESCHSGINDIALIELENPLNLRDSGADVLPICLPKPGEYHSLIGKMATVAGWGFSDPDKKSLPEVLQKIQVPIVNYSYCEQIGGYGSYPKHLLKPDEIPLLCAGYLNRRFDVGWGDSGAPLQIYDAERKQWTQVGVMTSTVDGDIPENLPDPKYAPTDYATATLYEEVERYLKFIDYRSKESGAKWCKSA